MPTIGVEIEMPVINARTGALHPVQAYFPALVEIKRQRGLSPHLERLGDRPVAVHAGLTVSGLDNAFNNLESSIGPLRNAAHNLDLLHGLISSELSDVLHALEADGATVINFSEHPFTTPDQAYYKRMRTPKPIYDYWVGYRGWNHMAGIDAKAHNGPTTGIGVEKAIRGLNLMLGLSCVFIGLYANSPFEGGSLARFKENRQTLWTRMFAQSRFACDRKLHGMPDKPFKDLRDYLLWMFGPDTSMQIVFGREGGDYKKPKDMLLAEDDPSALSFLRSSVWPARSLAGNRAMDIVPSLRHLEFLQFSNFLDTRLRYAFKDLPDKVEFLEALDSDLPLEPFFSEHAEFMYLEGRAAGANFPDADLLGLDDAAIPASVVISPSALQLGLLLDLDNAERIVASLDWDSLCGLRTEAIRYGMEAEYKGLHLADMADAAIEAAGAALPQDLVWALAYPRHVLATRTTGADRAINAFEALNGDATTRLRKLTLRRKVVLS